MYKENKLKFEMHVTWIELLAAKLLVLKYESNVLGLVWVWV